MWNGNGLNTEKKKKTELEKNRDKAEKQQDNKRVLKTFPPKPGKQPKIQASQLICHQHIFIPLGK